MLFDTLESSPYADTPLVHICEVCGLREIITPREAFEAGWDYPPGMGRFGIVSPRTCPNCRMEDTVWAELELKKKPASVLTSGQVQTILRILTEPDSILPEKQP